MSTHISQKLRVIVLDNRRANQVRPRREVHNRRIYSARTTIVATSPTTGDRAVDCCSIIGSTIAYNIAQPGHVENPSRDIPLAP
jgi:hypothetical protein